MTATGDCWYSGPEHRPAVGGCPPSCSGPVIYSERAGNGDQLLYCEAHAYWRRRTIRLPLVRRMRPGEGGQGTGVGRRDRRNVAGPDASVSATSEAV